MDGGPGKRGPGRIKKKKITGAQAKTAGKGGGPEGGTKGGAAGAARWAGGRKGRKANGKTGPEEGEKEEREAEEEDRGSAAARRSRPEVIERFNHGARRINEEKNSLLEDLSEQKEVEMTLIYTYLTICSMFDYPSLINFKCGFKYLFFVFR